MSKRIIYTVVGVLALVAAIIIGVRAIPAAPDHQPTGTKSAASTTPSHSSSSFNKAAYSLTDPSSLWVIVNKQHPLQPINYAPADLTPVGNGQYMRVEAAKALTSMLGDAHAAGYIVTPGSGYRSYATQVTVYNNEVTAYGQAVADSESARPGYSEHQTGLAMDLSSGNCNITDCFADTPGGKWVTANAYRYGFILRYPANLTDITGYRAEAWHFRYIGVPLATEMHRQGIQTLEQFFGVTGGTAYK